jgi:hypothetical protein
MHSVYCHALSEGGKPEDRGGGQSIGSGGRVTGFLDDLEGAL